MLLQRLFSQRTTLFKVAFNMAKSKKDLYQMLGVNKTASQSQIKKAYYKLAQQLHPDKNSNANAKDKFAEINNAYQVLSDQSKRKSYDQTGSTEENPYSGFENEDFFNQFRSGGFANKRGGQNPNMADFESIFEDLFGGGFSNQGGKRGRNKVNNTEQQREDISIKYDLDFNESVNGTTKVIQIKRRCTCSVCKGSRAKPGSKPQKCNSCQGTGYMTFHQGIMVMRAQCHACHGSGQTIGHPCTHCSGQGVEATKSNEEIKFPRGIDNGATLKFRGKGHVGGDLIVKVAVRKHPFFRRQGNDSFVQKQISVIDAILGTQVNIETIYGQSKKVKISPGMQNNDKIKLAKEGFYRLNSNQKGSHIVTIRIKIPTKISNEEKSLYERLKQISK